MLALYARGLTTREILRHLQDLYGVEISPTLISTIMDAVLEEVRTWPSRPLEALSLILYFACLFVKSRQEGMVKTKAVCGAQGATVLAVWGLERATERGPAICGRSMARPRWPKRSKRFNRLGGRGMRNIRRFVPRGAGIGSD